MCVCGEGGGGDEGEGEGEGEGVVDLYQGVGGGTGGRCYLIVFVFFLVLLCFVVSRSQSLYLGG